MTSRTISSKLVTVPPTRACARLSSFTAAAGEGTPMKAVSTARGRGNSLQHRGGDDAERAFGADEDVAQVVAGVVLLQLRQQVHDAAVGQHHLEPEHQIARDAVGDRAGAAGIGGEIAADGAAAFRAERQRKQPVDRRRRILRFRQHDAGFAVIVFDAASTSRILSRRVSDRISSPSKRDLPADQPGVAALRDQRRLGLVRELEDRLHLGDRAGPQQHRRAAMIDAAAFDQIRLERSRVGDRVFVADDGRKARQQVGRGRACVSCSFIHWLSLSRCARRA